MFCWGVPLGAFHVPKGGYTWCAKGYRYSTHSSVTGFCEIQVPGNGAQATR